MAARNRSCRWKPSLFFSISVSNHIRIEPEWIPQTNNQLADYLSRIVDYDDWYLDSSIFMYLEPDVGPHTVDCIASSHNTQLYIPVQLEVLEPRNGSSRCFYLSLRPGKQLALSTSVPHTTSNWACQKVSCSWHAGGS